MNDTNREAEIRERVRVEREPWPFDGHEQPAMDRALVLDDIAYLLSALDSERGRVRELEAALRKVETAHFGQWCALCLGGEAPALHKDDCPVGRALLTTEDSNKTTAVHTERNE